MTIANTPANKIRALQSQVAALAAENDRMRAQLEALGAQLDQGVLGRRLAAEATQKRQARDGATPWKPRK